MTNQIKNFIEKLIKDIGDDKSDLWDMDYGCDGADECCGNCGGNRLLESRIEERLKEIKNLL